MYQCALWPLLPLSIVDAGGTEPPPPAAKGVVQQHGDQTISFGGVYTYEGVCRNERTSTLLVHLSVDTRPPPPPPPPSRLNTGEGRRHQSGGGARLGAQEHPSVAGVAAAAHPAPLRGARHDGAPGPWQPRWSPRQRVPGGDPGRGAPQGGRAERGRGRGRGRGVGGPSGRLHRDGEGVGGGAEEGMTGGESGERER